MHHRQNTITDMHKLHDWLAEMMSLSSAAGSEIMQYYQADFSISHKRDASPVTAADHAAHNKIMQKLQQFTPHIPIISEELEEHPTVTQAESFWLIDPLDGTKSFIRGEDSFCVCIALVQAQRPVLGVIHWPVARKTYGGVVGLGAWRQQGDDPWQPLPHAMTDATPAVKKIVYSSHHVSQRAKDWMASLTEPVECFSLSSAQKFCLLAEGSADAYPRFAPTSEWDTAAGQAIVEAVGGGVFDWQGNPMRYGKAGFENGGFLALRNPTRDAGWLHKKCPHG